MQSTLLLLTIGNEILDGRTLNTNAQFFGEQLRLCGIAIDRVLTVADEISDIAEALEEAKRFKAVIVTGGLGPTNDDRTAEAAAQAFGRALKESPQALKQVRARYQSRMLPLTKARRKLAVLPQGARIIRNNHGAAPGFFLKEGAGTFYFLPGVPSECRPMFTENILPLVKKTFAQKKCIQRHFWRTFGTGESAVYGRVEKVVHALEKKYPRTFQFGVHITFPYIDLTMESWKIRGEKSPTSTEMARAKKQIDKAVGHITFTHERETLADALVKLLRKRKLTLATAESCTGGLVGKALTDTPGSSAIYLGGVVSYANSAKETLLNVRAETMKKFGAVSQETVKEMATSIRRLLGADYGLALSGVSGPGGGTKRKPIGTIHVAISSPKRSKFVHQIILSSKGSRDQNRIIAMNLALDALRTQILMEQRGARH